MAANTEPRFALAPNLAETTFTSADTTAAKTIWTPDATEGGKLTAIACGTDDTADVNMKVFINDGSTDYLVGVVNVPAGSGQDGSTPTVNLLDPVMLPFLDALGQLALPGGYSVKAGCLATMTAAKTTTVVAIGVDF
jgi:hypothetical protein